MRAIIEYRNEAHQKYCEVLLDSGEHVMLRMDPTGLRIERMADADGPAALLFQADVERAASIVVGLAGKDQARQGKVLDVLVATVMELRSAAKVAAAFRDAAKAVK